MQNKMRTALVFIVTLAFALGLGANAAVAQGPKESPHAVAAALGYGFTYQGQLKKNGNPISATCTFTFSLWDSSTFGNQIGSPQTQSLTVANGVFTSNPIDFGTGAFQGDARYLQITVLCPGDASATMLSRQTLTPVPYALALPGLYTQQNTTSPNLIGGYSGNTVDSGVYGATIGGGGANGIINHVSADFGTIGGGAMNVASGSAATVAGGDDNIASGTVSIIGGGNGNNASGDYASLGGGDSNIVSGAYAALGGGRYNTAGGIGAFVGGGGYDGSNTAGNSASGSASTIGGGYGNTAGGKYATVAGGYGNNASGNGAFIGGGGYGGAGLSESPAPNSATGPSSTVGGGAGNTAGGNAATISGGGGNTTSAPGTTIAGGAGNTASGSGSGLNSGFSTVGGGHHNTASGDASTVAGGDSNSASGGGATVPGGSGNTASGYYSFAAGYNSTAGHNGAFVWTCAACNATSSTADNQFIVSASGGIKMYTNTGLTTGVQVASGGGSWSSVSDRNLKANLQNVNSQDVLARLNAIPIQTWNYTTQDASIRHIGPMAQDFYAAFNVGEDDKHITTIDSEGVALAAIQGLYQVVQHKDAEIGQLKAESEKQQAELTDLKARMSALEQASSVTVHAEGQTTPITWVLFGGLVVVGWFAGRRRA